MNIVLSGTLQKYTDYQREHSVAAATVHDGIHGLVELYPSLSSILFDPTGALRRSHIVFLNGNQLLADQLTERVGDQDRIEILTAIAGG